MQGSPQVAVIPGDGIGPEVIAAALGVVEASGADLRFTWYDLGAERYLRTGEILPDGVLDELRGTAAILFGAVGSPEVPSGLLERSLLLRLRAELDLYVNLRPASVAGSDLVVVRENTEGSYVAEGGSLRTGTPREVATQGSVNTWFGVARCVRYAFELARSRPERSLTLVHKTNVLTYAGGLWQRVCDELGEEFGDVELSYDHVDAACIHLVRDPGRYDVIVTDNLFGDILTDLAAALGDGIGRAASGNLNPAGDGPSLFEPVHGSAPDIAGTGTADPSAAILSAAMMLRFLGQPGPATRIHQALERAGPFAGSTTAMGDAVVAALAAG